MLNGYLCHVGAEASYGPAGAAALSCNRPLTQLFNHCAAAAAAAAEGEGPAAVLTMLHQLNKRTCGGKCAVGSGGKTVG